MLSLHSTNSVVAVTLRGVEFLGKCHAASLVSVITMDESVDYSLMLLVDPVRGDISSTERHNIAAHTLQTIIGGLDQVLCAMYARRPNPDADVLPLDRHHNGGTRGDQVQQESKLNLNSTKRWTTASFSNSTQHHHDCLTSGQYVLFQHSNILILYYKLNGPYDIPK